MDVKVTVTNEDEGGVVTLSKTQPRVGIAVTASVTDPDGSISGLTWQWSFSADANRADIARTTEDGPIAGATSDTYTPKAGDVGGILTATASYFDGQSAPDIGKKTAMNLAGNAVAMDTRNRAPVFADQDTETDGLQNTMTTREVEENTKAIATDDDMVEDSADNVGSPVTANDPDPNADPLTYTLGGADASKFRVRQGDTTTQEEERGRSDRGGRRDEAGLRDQADLHGHGDGRGLLRRQRLHHGDYYRH